MTVMTTIDVYGMTADEYGRVMNRLGVESAPAAGIFLHMTAQTDFGYRVIEVWDAEENFRAFLADRLGPAGEAEGLTREMQVKVELLHNIFAPRLLEIPDLAASLPGGPSHRR